MRGDWKDEAEQYRDIDRAAQKRAEAEIAKQKPGTEWTEPGKGATKEQREAGEPTAWDLGFREGQRRGHDGCERLILQLRKALAALLERIDEVEDYNPGDSESEWLEPFKLLRPAVKRAKRALEQGEGGTK